MRWVADLGSWCRVAGGPAHVVVAARAIGVPVRRVREMARRERWWRPYPDVIAPPGTPRSRTTRALAALAQIRGADPAAPVPGALALWSGAAQLGVGPGAPSRPQVLVPATRGTRVDGPVEVKRARGFGPDDICMVGGVAVASAPWVVRTCAVVAETATLTDLVVDLVQRRHLTIPELVERHRQWPRYPGRSRVSTVLERLDEAGRTDSRLELDARRRLTGSGIPLDHGQVRIACGGGVTVHVDLGIAAIRFGIELDSMLAHSTREQLRADIRRANALSTVAEDWRIVRGTWEDLDAGWSAFLALVRRTITEQSRRYLGISWPRPEDILRA